MGITTDGLSYWQAETGGINLLEMTIGDLLDRRANELPTQEAIVYSCYPEFGDTLNIRWTYQDYRDQANAVAKGLLALGLVRGDHIAVWAANIPEWLLLEMAAAKAGLVLVTVNPLLQAAEVEYILKQGDVQALFFMARVRTYDHLATLHTLISPGARQGEVTSERLPRLRFLCLMGMPPAGLLEQQGWRPALLGEVTAEGLQVSNDLLSERQGAVTPLDPAMILYTSGTTGSPKGAMLTHRSLLNNGWLMAHRWRLEQTDRYCTPMPFFHAGGVSAAFWQRSLLDVPSIP
ncbi:MAG TPA: AMP-binding protein [Ktedonobacteraceae bacterium]